MSEFSTSFFRSRFLAMKLNPAKLALRISIMFFPGLEMLGEAPTLNAVAELLETGTIETLASVGGVTDGVSKPGLSLDVDVATSDFKFSVLERDEVFMLSAPDWLLPESFDGGDRGVEIISLASLIEVNSVSDPLTG